MTTSEFPVPADLQGFWIWAKMHCPRPQTPLTEDIVWRSASDGFSGAMDELACPFGIAYRVISYYNYMALVPLDLGSETIEERAARYQKTLTEMLPRMGELWVKEWLPTILRGIEKARAADYAAMSDEELLDTFEERRKDFAQRYLIHGRVNFILIAASGLVDFYNAALKPEDPTEPYLLLQGFPTRSVDAGRGLWRLSRTVKRSSRLRKLFEQVEPSKLLPRLGRSKEGRDFLGEFREYLDEFGWRSDAFELAERTWREDPRIPLNTLQGYIYLDDDGDPELRFQEAVQTRETLLAQARERLAGDADGLARFNELYETARPFLMLTEDHNFYIDQMGGAVMRLPILEMGRRLVRRGALVSENDIFMLYLSEIREGFEGKDQQARAAQRRAEIERWAKVVPPATLGEPPPPSDDPLVKAVLKFLGAPPEPSRDPDVINGIGASAGVAHGRARVVRKLSEAGKVQKGDILVCEMTMPAWTPLFSTVSAVVADTGGILSHCAIISREYRMPCVVSTIVGTSVIEDGMLLTVDGRQGIVRIESRV